MASQLSETAVLRKIVRHFPAARKSNLSLGLNDDTAGWRARPGYETLLTVDWFLEGTHFLRHKHSPDSIGWKCLARAASDIAAMGGAPRCFLLSIALPANFTGPWLTQFLQGLRRSSEKLGCLLAGGDTTCRDEILISITVVGEVLTKDMVRRSGARPGDILYVSGCLGEADLGLRQLHAKPGVARPTTSALRKHLYPQARVALGQWLARNHRATAMMDISDGLSTDLPRLCAASGVGACVDSAALPSPTGLSATDALALSLNGGDDYELLFTVSPRAASAIPSRFESLDLSRIGEIRANPRLLLRASDGKEKAFQPGGWDPFRTPITAIP